MARFMRAIQFRVIKLDGPDKPGHDGWKTKGRAKARPFSF
jgi:hypothetical protein